MTDTRDVIQVYFLNLFTLSVSSPERWPGGMSEHFNSMLLFYREKDPYQGKPVFFKERVITPYI